jgi:tRNA G18 (ribose-2'-O)-methylase SpoU
MVINPIYSTTKPKVTLIIEIPKIFNDNSSGKMLNISVVYQLMKKRGTKLKKYLILENIRSVYNVGAIFRTADAVGIDKIFLIGTTPTPIDRFGRERQDLHKAALGAEKNIPWEFVKSENIDELILKLKAEKFVTVAVEQSPKSLDYKKVSKKIRGKNVVMLVGNEVDGVSKTVLEKVDIVSEIPMNGSKESLNVSVATGVILYRFFDI